MLILSKRLIAIITSALLVISITGCSKNDTLENTEPTNSQTNISADDILGDKYLSDEPSNDDNSTSNQDDEQDLSTIINGDVDKDENNTVSNIVDIVVIDCNGADSTLIHSDYGNILIDFGSKDSINTIKNVLDNKGIKDINLAILTHAHPEHYGGLSEVVSSYNISKLIMTNSGDISVEYENILKTLDDSNIDVEIAKVDSNYTVGDIGLKIIGPSIDYEETDENSIVTLVNYKDFDMLITGGAGMIAEKDYVKYMKDIEVFTVGRHGNARATSDNLIETATPDIGIISCTSDSVSQEVLDKLAKYNIDTLRTDDAGTITIKTDGKEYNVIHGNIESIYITDENKQDDEIIETNQDNKDNAVNSGKENENSTGKENSNIEYVYTSPTSKYYHSTDKCSKLLIAREVNKVSLQDAVDTGAEKCPRCW